MVWISLETANTMENKSFNILCMELPLLSTEMVIAKVRHSLNLKLKSRFLHLKTSIGKPFMHGTVMCVILFLALHKMLVTLELKLNDMKLQFIKVYAHM